MLKMSFYDGTLDIPKAIQFIEETNKNIFYRQGYAWKGAKERPVSKEIAIFILKENSTWTNVREYEDRVLINQFSSSDLW